MPLPGHDVRESLRDALFMHSRHRNVLSFISMPEMWTVPMETAISLASPRKRLRGRNWTNLSRRCVPAVAVDLSTPGRRGLRCHRRFEIYPYRATFDFECYFSDERLPSDSDKLQWSPRHVPLSVSVASNVPGHEDAQCYVTNGDSDKLVEDMIAHLITLSDAAYDSFCRRTKMFWII